MAVRSALKLVVKGRDVYNHDNLKNHLCCMIELFLLLLGKLFAIDDQEIQSFIFNEWNLYTFIRELIQSLMSSTTFGGFGNNYHKEIEVGSYIIKIKCHLIASYTLNG